MSQIVIVCKTDDACANFPIYGEPDSGEEVTNMTCYKSGETVFQNHQACDVTSVFIPSSFSLTETHVLLKTARFWTSSTVANPK